MDKFKVVYARIKAQLLYPVYLIKVFVSILVVLIVALILLTIFNSPVGVSPDSAAYIGAARQILSGKGYSLPFGFLTGTPIGSPITHYPPLYAYFLSFLGLFGFDLVDSAKGLNIILFLLNFLLSTSILYKATSNYWITSFGQLLFLGSKPMLLIHTMALTESLFLFLSLFSLFLLACYLDTLKLKYLVLSSFLVGLAILVRYAGLALIPVEALAVIGLSRNKWRSRIPLALLAITIALLPFFSWMIRNTWVSGSLTSRLFIFHPVSYQKIPDAVCTLSGWILPLLQPHSLTLSFMIVVIAIIWWKYKPVPETIEVIHLIFIPAYLLFILLSALFFDAAIPFNDRILSPIFVPLMVIVLWLISKVQITNHLHQSFKIASTVVAIALLILSFYQARKEMTKTINGRNYAHITWRNSPFLRRISDLPENIVLYTNAPDVIYLRTGRPSIGLPVKYSQVYDKENTNYIKELETITNPVDRPVFVVFFKTLNRDRYPSEDELLELFNLKPVYNEKKGVIYEISQMNQKSVTSGGGGAIR